MDKFFQKYAEASIAFPMSGVVFYRFPEVR